MGGRSSSAHLSWFALEATAWRARVARWCALRMRSAKNRADVEAVTYFVHTDKVQRDGARGGAWREPFLVAQRGCRRRWSHRQGDGAEARGNSSRNGGRCSWEQQIGCAWPCLGEVRFGHTNACAPSLKCFFSGWKLLRRKEARVQHAGTTL